MSRIRLNFEIAAPLAAAWDLGVQPRRIPEWQFDVVRVEGAPERIETAGSKYVLVYWRFGHELPSPVSVTRYEPPCLIETLGQTPLGGYFRSVTRMGAVSGGSAVEWEMDYRLPGWIMGSLLDGMLFRRAFTATVAKYNENFKAAAEGRCPPHPSVREKHRAVGLPNNSLEPTRRVGFGCVLIWLQAWPTL